MSVREIRFMLTEFLPIQIALKTLAPIIFGGTGPSKLISERTVTAILLEGFPWNQFVAG